LVLLFKLVFLIILTMLVLVSMLFMLIMMSLLVMTCNASMLALVTKLNTLFNQALTSNVIMLILMAMLVRLSNVAMLVLVAAAPARSSPTQRWVADFVTAAILLSASFAISAVAKFTLKFFLLYKNIFYYYF